MSKRKKKALKVVIKKGSRQNNADRIYQELNKKSKQNSRPILPIYQYHSLAFHYFHNLIPPTISYYEYRKSFWIKIVNGKYNYDEAQKHLVDYKNYIESILEGIIKKYSITYWLHLSRRIAPNVIGDDHRSETIMIAVLLSLLQFKNLAVSPNVKIFNFLTI